MRGLFQYDGPVFSALSRLTDMIILNLLFLVCSLPIVTLGASFTALCSVLMKMKDGNEGYIIRSFFQAFRRNFKQATLVWGILLVWAAVLYVDSRLSSTLPAGQGLIRAVVYVGALLWLMIFFYVFPLIARFENTTIAMLKNAVLIAVANAPRTLLILLAAAAAYYLPLMGGLAFAIGLTLWLFVGFSLIAWVTVTLQRKVFLRFMPPEGDDEGVTEEAEDPS